MDSDSQEKRGREKMTDFSSLRRMILPLFGEQLLVALVGMADVFVVGFVGEAAVSGVSLVNSFNTIFINLFTALASGGAVVISQYIGRNEAKQAGKAASQLLAASVLLAFIVNENLRPGSTAQVLLMKGLLTLVCISVLYVALLCFVPETGWFSDIYPWSYQDIIETVLFWT